MTVSPLTQAAERLEEASFLDPAAEPVGRFVRENLPAEAKSALTGAWLGHALHPLLTDVVVGAWTSALLLDLTGGRESEQAARRLIAIGLVSAPPTFLSGWTDWADTEPASDAVRRAGIVHALSNGLGAVAMTASLVARRRGRTGRAKLFSLAGMSLVSVGGWLGGHLSYSRGVGVDTNALHKDVTEWSDALAVDELVDDTPVSVTIGGVAVMIVRQQGEIHALANRCAHRGGPLDEGELGDGTITCPLHGSCYRLSDGTVEHGPSAYAQPVFETRVAGGRLQVRARSPKSFVTTV